MRNQNKKMTDIILDEGLIHDFEFESRIYKAGSLEDFQSYLGKKKLINSNIF